MNHTTQNIFFNTNLKYLRERKKLNQEKLAQILAITRSKLAALETGTTKAPPPEDYVNISAFFQISIDTLLKIDLRKLGELKVRELEAGNDIYIRGGNLRVLAVSVDRTNNEHVEYVPIKARAGYASGGYSDQEYIAELPKYNIPNLPRTGTYRTFPITGDSMLPFPDGTDITGRFVQDWHTLKPGTLAIVVLSGTQDIVFKSITLSEEGNLECRSLNELYEPYTVPAGEVREIWEYYAYTTREIPKGNADMDRVLNALEEIKSIVRTKTKR